MGCRSGKMKVRKMTLLALVAAIVMAGTASASDIPVLGDYDAELRAADGHVDSALMVKRLQDLGANTYMWLIWHSPDDWEDLQAFLPLARQAGIRVWVYLVPHSESGPDYPYSEPFRLDYIRWAQEIAKLSLKNPNLVGYVIDDFRANMSPGRFTPDYIRRMTRAGKTINPKLRFYPLLYYPEINARLVQDLAPVIDGVVAAYPGSKLTIKQALRFLNDEARLPGGATISLPADTPSAPGDCGFVGQRAQVRDAARARVSFRYMDDFTAPTAGYHFLQLRVDGEVVWERDCEGRDNGEADVDISRATPGKDEVVLEFGVADKKGVSNFPLNATFARLRLTGLEMANPDMDEPRGWTTHIKGAFRTTFSPPAQGTRRFRLPLIVMTAGSRGAYAKRHGRQATSERIAAQVRMGLELLAAGEIEGVVTYCLDKNPGSEDLEAVAAAYRRYRAAHPPTPAND